MIAHPTLVPDIEKVSNNIREICDKTNSLGLEFRPHFKTHQSRAIGKLFRNQGIQGITVSSLRMAKYFAEDKWESITVAIPVNILEHELINDLASQVELRLLTVDATTIKKLDSKLTQSVKVYIELDPGYGRSGIPVNEHENIANLISVIKGLDHISLHGFYTHSGHTYKCRSIREIKDLTAPILNDLETLKRNFGYPVCYGDTPSCSVLDEFGPVNEISAGNLVFYDWTQVQIGSCKAEQIGIAMFCPVLAKYDDRRELLIHGGAVHFSKDSFTSPGEKPYFGVVAEIKGRLWGEPVNGVIVSSISQEHGIVSCTDEYFNTVNVGDVIPILPIHSCLNADLMGEYMTTNGDILDHMNGKLFRV